MKRGWTKEDFYKLLRERNGCLEWSKTHNGYGYGVTYVPERGRMAMAHRLALELEGVELGSLHVLHRCDNPLCCNPKHLFLGTQEDNMKDMAQKKRSTIGIRNPRARLKESDVIEIRKRCSSGETQRSVAAAYSVHPMHIHDIVVFKRWKHVTEIGA